MEVFIRKLRRGARLSEADAARLRSLGQSVRQVQARADIIAAGSGPRWLPLIVEGWACRYRLLENGRRQIISLFLPGDLCEPFGVLPSFTDTAVGALTAVTIVQISLPAIREEAQSSPQIEQALWWDLLVASAIEREHIVSLGRRSATERLGHLFCELHLRLEMVGLVSDGAYDLPPPQSELSDMLGLSAVHLNRSLQELRKTGLVSLRGRRLAIHDLEGLGELSLFDPAYLHPGEEGLHDLPPGGNRAGLGVR